MATKRTKLSGAALQRQIAAINKAFARVEKLTGEAATIRDRLRDAISEVEEIAESFDRGIESIDQGARMLREGIDAMSERI